MFRAAAGGGQQEFGGRPVPVELQCNDAQAAGVEPWSIPPRSGSVPIRVVGDLENVNTALLGLPGWAGETQVERLAAAPEHVRQRIERGVDLGFAVLRGPDDRCVEPE